MLAIAAEFYTEDPASSLLRVDIGLGGLDQTIPGPRRFMMDSRPRTVHSYTERRVLATLEVKDDPVAAARQLLDRLLVSLLPAGIDIFDELSTGSH